LYYTLLTYARIEVCFFVVVVDVALIIQMRV